MSARAVLFAHIHQTSFNVETIGRSGPFLKGCLHRVIHVAIGQERLSVHFSNAP
jgi:hypothetical protein